MVILAGVTGAVSAAPGCASKQKPPEAPKPPPLTGVAVHLPPGEPLSARRSEPDQPAAGGLPEFLGETAPPLLECGLQDAARAAYSLPGGSEELVLLLLEFPDGDHAQCAFDAARPAAAAPLSGFPAEVRAETRPLPGDRLVLTLVKGRTVARVFTPGEGPARQAADALAQHLATHLPDDAAARLPALMPAVARVEGSLRTVAKHPLFPTHSPVLVARFECSDGVLAQGVVALFETPARASEAQVAYQVRAVDDFMSVQPFKLGEVDAVSAVDTESHKETLMMARGPMVTAVRDMESRKACMPVVEAMLAALPVPPPPDAGVTGADGGPQALEDAGVFPETDGGPSLADH